MSRLASINEKLHTHGPLVFVVASVLATVWWTAPYTQGDSTGYARQIAAYRDVPLLGDGDVLWEFGHLMWRPLGWSFLQLASFFGAPGEGWAVARLVLRFLTLVSFASGIAAILLWYDLASRVSRSPTIAAATALAVALSNSVLLYSQNGCSYVAGLFFVTLSLWLTIRGLERGAGQTLTFVLSGVALAVAGLVWFPYVLSASGIATAALLWRPDDRPANGLSAFRLRLAGVSMTSFSVSLATAYGLVGWLRGFRSMAEYSAWVTEARHGLEQSLGIVRMITGLPRSFVDLGRDSIVWKRYLFEDPYAPTTLIDCLTDGGLWKLAIFYGLFMAVIISCLTSSLGRRSLAILAAGTLPLLLFAVVLFEPSAVERYLPAFPFIVLSIASALSAGAPKATKVGIVVCLTTIAATNMVTMNRWTIYGSVDVTVSRLMPLQDRLAPESIVVSLTHSDNAYRFRRDFPFHPFNDAGGIEVWDLLELGSERIETWKRDFALRTLGAWDSNGEVWVTTRAWAERPRPEWLWVEGDDARISWSDVHRFFQTLEVAGDTGTADGFARIGQTENNGAVLRGILSDGSP